MLKIIKKKLNFNISENNIRSVPSYPGTVVGYCVQAYSIAEKSCDHSHGAEPQQKEQAQGGPVSSCVSAAQALLAATAAASSSSSSSSSFLFFLPC